MEFDYPETLDFHLPKTSYFLEAGIINDPYAPTKLDYNDDVGLYRQLVHWTLIQRYWYYIIKKPQVEDQLYDCIEQVIREMEESADYLNNPFSPTKKVGSDRYTDYPPYIRWLFRNEYDLVAAMCKSTDKESF